MIRGPRRLPQGCIPGELEHLTPHTKRGPPSVVRNRGLATGHPCFVRKNM